MKNTIDFLSEIKTEYSLNSNYALARKLDKTDTDVSRWMNGKNTLGDDMAIKVADLLDLDPAYVVACVHAERAKQQSEKELWERIALMASGVATAASIAMFVGIFGAGMDAAEMNNATNVALQDYVVGRAGIEPATNGLRERIIIALIAVAFIKSRLFTIGSKTCRAMNCLHS